MLSAGARELGAPARGGGRGLRGSPPGPHSDTFVFGGADLQYNSEGQHPLRAEIVQRKVH